MFRNNDLVKVSHKGKILDGRIGSSRTWADLEPSYCDSQEVNFKAGRMGWGYRVHMPIVKEDGTFYTDRAGKPLMGLSYVDEKLIAKA